MLIPVILSGGAGSRLWPVSREGHPKPFMRLADGKSLLEKTYRRALSVQHGLDAFDRAEMLTVTNRDYFFMSRDEQDAAGVNGNFVLEPFGRNTAPAVALAAHAVAQDHGADAVMLVLAADHLILNPAAFERSVAAAFELAENNYLVTFGVLPSAPETGFGYIQRGEAIDAAGYRVARFVEKPDLTTAQQYLDSGEFFWNSGMFCFKAGTFLEELKVHAPEIATKVAACWEAMSQTGRSDMREIPAAQFEAVPDLSVDYAVMERSQRVAVVPGDFGWSDIGSWNAVRDLVPADGQGNRVVGDAILVDSSNTFVQSQDRLVTTLGVENLMIVDTPDALLVASPDKSQDVKKIVAELKRHEHEAHRLHKTVSRPWGTYTVLENSAHFKIKRIEVKPGASLSLQMHQHRSEHWVVVSGIAKVTNGDDEILVHPNESTYIPAGHKHRLENPGAVNCVLIEVQCGTYLGEDDIVRFDDVYGRSDSQ
jgi:mannose-1-phosphate guanylyltransferase